MKNCGCASDTLSSLLMMRPADRAWTSAGVDARGGAGLAEQTLEVNRPRDLALAASWRGFA
jgi:hypothetical protein